LQGDRHHLARPDEDKPDAIFRLGRCFSWPAPLVAMTSRDGAGEGAAGGDA
jgi:hypothetical protein